LRQNLKNLEENEKLSEPITAILIESKLENVITATEDFASPFADEFERARNALGIIFGETFEPFAVAIANGEDVSIKMILPRAKGIHIGSPGLDQPNFNTAKANEASAKRIMKAQASEDRYRFLLNLYLQATRQVDPRYRAVHLFTCLEALASGQINAEGSRDRIRMFLGYGYDEMFPYFQIGNEKPINVDHIGIVGKVRDQIFHGFSTPQISKNDAEGYKIFQRNPGMFALMLARDCMALLTSSSHIRPDKPADKKKRQIPDRGYRWHVVADEDPNGRNLALRICCGEKRGEVQFFNWIRDYTGGGLTPFKIAIPGGKQAPTHLDEIGYGVELLPFDMTFSQSKA
tara:strand:- start:13956 stop:14993 length:1038 start_codon:yes stop_codon:yes gene_type:complete